MINYAIVDREFWVVHNNPSKDIYDSALDDDNMQQNVDFQSYLEQFVTNTKVNVQDNHNKEIT